MKNRSIILAGKTLSKISKQLNLGNGSTWPGHIALKANPTFIEDSLKNSPTKIIMVAGTNGKTTTSRMIRTVLEGNDLAVIHNESGANLLNGIASTLVLRANHNGKITADYAIFEVDENALPQALSRITPNYLIILNLFRDQLDRYGEVDTVAQKWQKALEKLPETTQLLLNADDPRVAHLASNTKAQASFFGLEKKVSGTTSEHSADSLFCPRCGEKLTYDSKTYSHLGHWHCPHCKLQRPETEKIQVPFYPLSGTYNEYNTIAVVLLAKLLSLPENKVEAALHTVKPAFGRQEIIQVGDKKVQLFLSKNPTGFNESLKTISELGAKHLLLVLNDRVADGHDVSWIWDVDFESFINQFSSVTISGDRVYDMGLRLKYTSTNWQMANSKWKIEENLAKAITIALEQTTTEQPLFVLPTYTAMLEVRKIISGKKIL